MLILSVDNSCFCCDFASESKSIDGKNALSFGDLLQKLRTRKKVNQKVLAEKLGVHRNTVGAWERGDCLPDTRVVILELAKQLRLDTHETRALLEASLIGLSSYWYIPFQRNPFFTGRASLLQRLHECLYSKRSVALSQSYALSGLGGIGKTQLALEYAYQHVLNYNAIFWIAAETSDTISASFSSIAEQLQLPEHQEGDQQKIVKAVLRWLAIRKGWLLIFDNVEDTVFLKPFLPSARQGVILMTTRMNALGGLAYTFKLSPFSSKDAMTFLLRRAGLVDPLVSREIPAELKASAHKLIEAMDGLPLALDQAGGYIEKVGCSFEDYLLLYQSHQVRLLNERSEVADHPHSVLKTFLLSFEKLAQINPLAADLLHFCAFLAPEAIPEDLFLQKPGFSASISGVGISDLFILNQALGDAMQYSLLHRQPQSRTFSLHRLVQVALRASLDDESAHLRLSKLVEMLTAVVSHIQDDQSPTHDDRYVPHVRAVIDHITQRGDEKELQMLAPLWYYLGFIAWYSGQFKEAETAYLEGLKIEEELHSPLEVYFLVNLAMVKYDLGEDDQLASTYLEKGIVFAKQYQNEGLLCRAYLVQGEVFDAAGEYQRAEPWYREGLAIAQRIQHISMISCFLQDLGVYYGRRGDYDKSEKFHGEGLIYAQRSGQLRRQSALLLNLGMLSIYKADYEEALAYSLESLRLAQQVNSRVHMSAVSQNIGIIYRLQGQLEQAQLYLDESLRLAYEIEHRWYIAETLGEYGWLLLEQKLIQRARETFNQMLHEADSMKAVQLIAIAQFGLARVAVEQHRWEEARLLALESLEGFKKLDNRQQYEVSQLLTSLPQLQISDHV